MTTNLPAGWYPDQFPGTERYWDGTTWTGQTRQVWPAPPPPGYMMPTLSGPPLASYGRRLGGWLLDWLLVGLVSAPLLLVFHGYQRTHTTVITNGVTFHESGFHVGAKGVLIHALVAILYGTVMCGTTRGQTLGMMAVHVRVVRLDSGGPIGYGRAFGRALLEYVLAILLVIPWVIDVLFPLWDSLRQTLHDKAAGAIVINTY